MEGSPLTLISHRLIRLFLQNLPLSYQLPFYSLILSVVLLFTHILVILNLNYLLLRQVRALNLVKKKKDAGYLRIPRGCFQGQKKTKGIIIHVSYVASYFLGH